MSHEHHEHPPATMDHDAHAHHHAAAADADGCIYNHAMAFHSGVCQEILFPGWRTTSGLELLGSAVAIFLAGVLYEGLKYYREALHNRATSVSRDSQVNITKNECGNNGPCGQTATLKYSIWSGGHIAQTLLHVVQSSASYILMLVFMTYNVWLCIALIAGLGLGYFLFGWRKNTVVDVTEHCQ